MKKLILLFVLVHLQMATYGQERYIRKLTGYSSIDYSNDQKYVFLSKENRISVIPVSGTSTLSQLVETRKTAVVTLFSKSNGAELISVLSDGISVWRYMDGAKLSTFQIEKGTILGASLIDDNRVAYITETELVVFSLSENKILFKNRNHEKFIRCVASSTVSKIVVGIAG